MVSARCVDCEYFMETRGFHACNALRFPHENTQEIFDCADFRVPNRQEVQERQLKLEEKVVIDNQVKEKEQHRILERAQRLHHLIETGQVKFPFPNSQQSLVQQLFSVGIDFAERSPQQVVKFEYIEAQSPRDARYMESRLMGNDPVRFPSDTDLPEQQTRNYTCSGERSRSSTEEQHSQWNQQHATEYPRRMTWTEYQEFKRREKENVEPSPSETISSDEVVQNAIAEIERKKIDLWSRTGIRPTHLLLGMRIRKLIELYLFQGIASSNILSMIKEYSGLTVISLSSFPEYQIKVLTSIDDD